jgi:hypothetical protein
MAKNPSATPVVISSAARNLRSLTCVRDDNATFGDCDTVSRGEIQKGSVNEPAHGLRSDKNRDSVGVCKLFNRHPQVFYACSVLSEVGLDPIGVRRPIQDTGVTRKDGYIAAVLVGIEVQGDSRITGDMAQLGLVPFAEDQNSFAVPMKPDRPRLRRVVRIDGGQPDDLLLAQATVYVTPKSSAEIKHGKPLEPV